jgi:hypothetical protein
MRMHAFTGGGRMGMAELATSVLTAGIGFVLADGLDRFFATYNPSATTAPPADKFTSTGAGTLGNGLNVATRPNMYRIGVGAAAVAAPLGGAVLAKRSPMLRSAMEGMAVGAGIKFFSMLWSNIFVPLFTPKDTSIGGLQKSYVARLYPMEVAAHLNLQANLKNVASAGSGALSGAPQLGMGAPDVGPFALSDQYPTIQQNWGTGGESPYPDAAQALRSRAGMSGPGSDYPTATQAMRAATGIVGYEPGPPPGSGPGPKASPHTDPSCGCIGDDLTIGMAGVFSGPEEESPFNP